MFQKKFLNLFMMIALMLSMSACTLIGKDQAGLKAENYLKAHVLKDGISAKVSTVTDEKGFYTVSLDVSKNNELVDKVKVYVTKNGETLSLGPVFNMNQDPSKEKKKENNSSAKVQDISKQDKPKVELFIMSGCPYGVQAEQVFSPVIKLLGDKIDFEPHFIIYPNFNGGGTNFCIDKGNKYCSMHGAEEAREDARQICIWKDFRGKWWSYIDKFNEKCQINDKTPACSKEAAKAVGVDYAKVEACLKSSAEKLLAEEVALSTKKSVSGSPTIFINGIDYAGGRSPNEILASICNSFKNKPKECNQKLQGSTTPAPKGGCGGG